LINKIIIDLGVFMSVQLNSNRLLLIENPKSGKGNTKLAEFKKLLYVNNFSFEARNIDESVSIENLVHDIDKFNAVIVAGGDGTVCSTAHALAEKDIPILVFPAGTANLISQNLGLPTEPIGLIEVLIEGKNIEIDIAQLEGGERKIGFIVAAGAGFDAEMIRESESLKPAIGAWAYLIGAMKQLKPVKSEFTLNMDGRIVKTSGMAVIVANLGMINFRMPIADGIDPADGKFNVIVLNGNSSLSLIPNIIDSVKEYLGVGKPAFHENLEIYTCKNITIESDPPLPIQYDGELLEINTPFTVNIMPKSARFYCTGKTIST
jgi:diacylglycerol kinase (ATP)